MWLKWGIQNQIKNIGLFQLNIWLIFFLNKHDNFYVELQYITHLTVCSKITIDCISTIQERISIIGYTSINDLQTKAMFTIKINPINVYNCLNTL